MTNFWRMATVAALALIFSQVMAEEPSKPTKAFLIFQDFIVDSSTQVEIENMPAIRNQNGLGSCFACGAATIVQKFLCDRDPEWKKPRINCNELPASRMVSQLGMIAWADVDRLGQDVFDDANHRNIRLYSDRTNFSYGSNALLNSSLVFEFLPESCFQISRFEKYNGNDPKPFREAYERAQSIYSRIISNVSTDADLAQLQIDFNTQFDSARIKRASSRNTFGEFLYALLFDECLSYSEGGLIFFRNELITNARPRYKFNATGISRMDALGLISSVVNRGSPLLLSSICMEVSSNGAHCVQAHDVVVSGYRHVCKAFNGSRECRLQLKLHNCWGSEWQRKNNDGWVDGTNLLKNVSIESPNLDKADIAWLE